jgi:hypothetical protein
VPYIGTKQSRLAENYVFLTTFTELGYSLSPLPPRPSSAFLRTESPSADSPAVFTSNSYLMLSAADLTPENCTIAD